MVLIWGLPPCPPGAGGLGGLAGLGSVFVMDGGFGLVGWTILELLLFISCTRSLPLLLTKA